MGTDLILALDTGTPTASVALVGAGDRPRIVRFQDARSHGPTVLQIVSECLAEAQVAPEDLVAVACGRGPGSFTGLRIGLASAKGLCFALDIPLLLPSSLESLARATRVSSACVVVPCLDARRQELFAAAYQVAGPGSTPLALVPALAGSAEQVAERLNSLAPEQPLLLVGNGVNLYRDRLLAALGDRAAAPDDAPQTPDAAILADLGREALARGEVADLVTAEPEYIRPSDAEQNRERRRAQALLKDVELDRESGLLLDRNGQWHHQGQPVTHERLSRALTGWLDREPGTGRFILRLSKDFWAYVQVEDAPFQAALRAVEPGGLIFALSDGHEVSWTGRAIYVGPDDAWYITVRQDRFEARLHRSALAALAEYLVEDPEAPQGVTLVLPGGKRIVFKPRADGSE